MNAGYDTTEEVRDRFEMIETNLRLLRKDRESTNELLVKILAQLERMTPNASGVSSAKIKTAASKRDNGLFVDIEISAYAGSEVPLVEALANYTTGVIQARALQDRNWQASVEELQDGVGL